MAPIKEVKKGGKTYYKYGDSGKEYQKRDDAVKQMRAIKASQNKRKK